MKKGIIITIIIFLLFSLSVGIGFYFIKINKTEEIEQTAKIEQNVTNTTIETVEANTDKVKITPNTKLVLKKFYIQCNHTINTYVELPKELVNLDEQELKKEYEGWKVDKFTQDEVILLKEENAFCDEHYIIKEYSGRIAIYKINKNGAEILEKVTSISTEYLTEHDLLNIKNGIKVYGLEQLNKTLEDYE